MFTKKHKLCTHKNNVHKHTIFTQKTHTKFTKKTQNMFTHEQCSQNTHYFHTKIHNMFTKNT